MTLKCNKEFIADSAYLHEMIAFISGFAYECGFLLEDVKNLELASEEAIVNVISYAYQGLPGGNIWVDCIFEDRLLRVDIIDTGVAFNPLEAAEPNLTESLEDRKIGGLGIFFIKKFIDHVCYRREDDKNILSLVMKASKV